MLPTFILSVLGKFSMQSITNDAPDCFRRLDGEWCGIKDDFVGAVLKPLDYWFAGFFESIFWALIVLLVYMKYKDALYAGLVGVIILVTTTGIRGDFTTPGIVLLALSAGVAITAMLMRLRK